MTWGLVVWKRGLKWTAISGRGCTLQPHWKSIWNLGRGALEGAPLVGNPETPKAERNLQLAASGAELQQPRGVPPYLRASRGTTPCSMTILPARRPPKIVAT